MLDENPRLWSCLMDHVVKTIAILFHAKDGLDQKKYFLHQLVDIWKRKGMKIVVLNGVENFVPADVIILHVNLTVVPKDYLLFAKRFPVAVNGKVVDISKRLISSNLVSSPREYDGPVIVKTNRNAGGRQEQKLRKLSGPIGWLQYKVFKQLSWSWSGYLKSSDYPIFASTSMVPRAVWKNHLLVVEKFLPERQDQYYCLRQWVFFGDREINSRSFSFAPIVKAFNIVDRERGLPVPPELRKLRQKLGFDYGKFDYGIINGKVVLYDTNRTPTVNDRNPNPDVRTLATELAQGMTMFLN